MCEHRLLAHPAGQILPWREDPLRVRQVAASFAAAAELDDLLLRGDVEACVLELVAVVELDEEVGDALLERLDRPGNCRRPGRSRSLRYSQRSAHPRNGSPESRQAGPVRWVCRRGTGPAPAVDRQGGSDRDVSPSHPQNSERRKRRRRGRSARRWELRAPNPPYCMTHSIPGTQSSRQMVVARHTDASSQDAPRRGDRAR